MQKKIDEAAQMWEKTRDPKYKTLWYKLIKEHVNGTNNFKRRTVSVNSCHKANDGTYIFVGTSKLHGPVRNTSNEVDGILRHTKHTHHE